MIKTAITLIIALAALFSFTSAYAEGVTHGGDVLYTKPVKSVLFSHKLHVEDKGLSCDRCHPKPFEPTARRAEQNKDFTMQSMYNGKYCGACHNGKTAFASNTQCARCHGGVKEYEATSKKPAAARQQAKGPSGPITIGSGNSAVKFKHDTHAARAACNDCHSGAFPMKRGASKAVMADMYKGKSCGMCHNGTKAFSTEECTKCHSRTPAPKGDLVYKTKDLGPVSFSHAFHAKAFKCGDCHDKTFRMRRGGNGMNMDAMYQGKYCGKCHNGTMASAVTDCAKCHK